MRSVLAALTRFLAKMLAFGDSTVIAWQREALAVRRWPRQRTLSKHSLNKNM